MDMPNTGKGFIHWASLGLGGAIVALLVAYLVPSIIPAKSAATRL
jgi:membrane-associated phospholipid phosphatase